MTRDLNNENYIIRYKGEAAAFETGDQQVQRLFGRIKHDKCLGKEENQEYARSGYE